MENTTDQNTLPQDEPPADNDQVVRVANAIASNTDETTAPQGPINDPYVQVCDLQTLKVLWVPNSTFIEDRKNGGRLSRDIPPLVRSDGRAMYDERLEVHKAIDSAIRRLTTVGKPDLRTHLAHIEDAVIHAYPHTRELIVDLLIEQANTLEAAGDPRNAGVLRHSAEEVLDRIVGEQLSSSSQSKVEWESRNAIEKILPQLDRTTLSNKKRFGDFREEQHQKAAATRVITHLERAQAPFGDVVSGIQNSLTSNLETKLKQYEVAPREDRRELEVEIKAIQANLTYCQNFLDAGADFDTFEPVATALTAQIQDEIVQEGTKGAEDIHEGETKLQAISSLKGQFREARKERDSSLAYIYGDARPGSGLIVEAATARRRALSDTFDEGNIPQINVIAAEQFGRWLSEALSLSTGKTITSTEDLLSIYEDYLWNEVLYISLPVTERKNKNRNPVTLAQRQANESLGGRVSEEVAVLRNMLHEIQHTFGAQYDIDRVGFAHFMAETYVSSIDGNTLDQMKSQIMRFLMPALDYALKTRLSDSQLDNEDFIKHHELQIITDPDGNYFLQGDVRGKYDQLLSEIGADVSTDELIASQEARNATDTINELGHTLDAIVNYLGIPLGAREIFIEQHESQISSVLLANYELEQYANDEHLNPLAVLHALTDAMFSGKPISLQIVRCLRWCYPLRDLQFTPHAGDFETLGPKGEPIIRKESVDREKLAIFNQSVVAPVAHHGIPIRDITLLCTGDFEITGGGYGLSEDDQRAVDARAYVDDLRTRVPEWNVFDKTIPIRVVSFRELVHEYGKDRYEQLLGGVQMNYDALSQNRRLNFLGFTADGIERTVNVEHPHRMPFVYWWSRKRTRDYTRHFTTFSLALGSVIAAQPYPKILTVSGNQYAGKTFSFGHVIDPTVSPLGVTLYKSVNDGTQSDLYKKMSIVIN